MSAPSVPIIQPKPWASLSSITFYWAPPSSIGGSLITNYTLLCSTIPYSTIVGPNIYNIQVSPLVNSVDYVFQIAATNSYGTSPYAKFNIAQAGASAAGASSVTVSTIDVSTVNVNWLYSTNANEAKAQFFAISIVPSTGTTSTMFAYANERTKYITNLSTNNYTFLVQAITDAGWAFPNSYSYSPMTPVGNTGPSPLVFLNASSYSGTGTWFDSSSNGKNATLENGVAAKNAAGNGVVFNGSTSWTFPNLSAGYQWTIHTWYKSTGSLGGGAIVTQDSTSGSFNMALADNSFNNRLYTSFYYNMVGFTIDTLNYQLPLGTWINIISVCDGATIKAYINGSLTNTTTISTTPIVGSTAYVMGRRWDGTLGIRGEIGELRIYKTPLTAAQALDLYTTTSSTYAPKLLVHLYATTYSGTGTWNDTSPNGKNATLEGGTIAKNAAGNGIVLDGSTSWTFPNVTAGNSWTASVWFKSVAKATWNGGDILTQIYNTSFVRINLLIGNNNSNVFAAQFLNGSFYSGNTITLVDGQWTNIQATWNGTNLSTYINGTLLGTTTPGGTSPDSGLGYRIGGRWDLVGYVKGEIGEVRIYDAPLSAAQVLTLYTSTQAAYVT